MEDGSTLARVAFLVPSALGGQERLVRATHIGAVDSIMSDVLGERRPYLVYTPPSYSDTTSTPQHYPVLYLLDGDTHFHSVTGLVQILATGENFTYAIPEMIVVGIPNTNRLRDLTPTKPELGPDGEPNPPELEIGGNAEFFAFLEKELMPRIDARYRMMPYRLLSGHSLGGLTVLNALYEVPDLFDAYISIEPSLWWDDDLMVRRAREYFESTPLPGRALYVAQANTIEPDDPGSVDEFSSFAEFDATVRRYDRSGVRYAFRYYEDDDHGSVALIAGYDALRFVFEGYRLPLQRIMAEPDLLSAHFRELSQRLGKNFRPAESLIRLFGRAALGDDNEAAVAFGELRVELYPDSYRAHEFLGNAWSALGDARRATRYYEQALERNPGSERIREKIRALTRP